MSVHALSGPSLRRSAQRPAAAPRRGTRKKAAGSPTRNSLATDFLAICKLDPSVDAVRSPATVASFALTGRRIEYRADFEAIRDGATTLVDIVTDADLAQHPLREILADGAAEAVDGRRFVVETAATLRAEPRLTTVKLVMACARIHV